MATYLDVASLVGIKIHSSGVISNGTVNVPAGNYYALASIINAESSGSNFNSLQSIVVGAGEAMVVTAGGQASISGVNLGEASGSKINYVIYTNNQ
tara:strand:- start:1378 stop:1665 length:288 start_codon:yes stop_codon:yes gene_type:complete